MFCNSTNEGRLVICNKSLGIIRHHAMALGQAVLEIIGLQPLALRAHYFCNALVLGCYNRHKNLFVFSRAFVGTLQKVQSFGVILQFCKVCYGVPRRWEIQIMSMFYARERQIKSRAMSLLELSTRVATMPPMLFTMEKPYLFLFLFCICKYVRKGELLTGRNL